MRQVHRMEVQMTSPQSASSWNLCILCLRCHPAKRERIRDQRLLWPYLDSLKGGTFAGKHRRHLRPPIAKDIKADS